MKKMINVFVLSTLFSIVFAQTSRISEQSFLENVRKRFCDTIESCNKCSSGQIPVLKPFGTIFGVKCFKCACVDPCDRACPIGYTCKKTIVQCIKAPCPPIVECISKNPCDYGKPLTGYFCGRGPTRKDCPKNSSCVIDPADRFAVCCPNDPCGNACNPDENLKCDLITCNPGDSDCKDGTYGCVTKCYFPPCAPPPIDPETGETRTCPYGNAHDSDGCFQCGCFDPCANVRCGFGKTCVAVPAPSCDKGYCPPYYGVCV